MLAAQSPTTGSLERVVIRTGDGRTFDLGKPGTLMFRLRVFIYRIRRHFNG